MAAQSGQQRREVVQLPISGLSPRFVFNLGQPSVVEQAWAFTLRIFTSPKTNFIDWHGDQEMQ